MNFEINKERYFVGVFDSSNTFPEKKVTDNRRVECYEIEIYTENGGTSYINGVPHKIRVGLMLVSKPDDHRYSELPLRTNYIKISTADDELRDFLDGLPTEMLTTVPEVYSEIIKEMLCAEALDDEFLFHSGFFRLLSMLKKDAERYKLLYENADTVRRDAVSRGLDFIERNFTKKCTLSDIAAHVHLSEIYFHTVFKSAIGKTPYEYVNSLRLEEAKRRLLTSYSEKSGFSDIAFDCGFSSQSYFNHAFKKSTGMTPGEYRKKKLDKYLSYGGLAPKKRT